MSLLVVRVRAAACVVAMFLTSRTLAAIAAEFNAAAGRQSTGNKRVPSFSLLPMLWLSQWYGPSLFTSFTTRLATRRSLKKVNALGMWELRGLLADHISIATYLDSSKPAITLAPVEHDFRLER